MTSTRTSRGGTAMNYMFSLPRGLSFKLFDNPNNSQNSYSAPAVAEAKPVIPLSRVNSTSKPSAPPDMSYPGAEHRHRQNSNYDRSHDRKPSGGSRSFAIYPTETRNTYVYEPSLSSKSDLQLPDEADADSFVSFPGDNASILARSSRETLLGGDIDSDTSSDTESGRRTPRRVVPVNLPALIEAQSTLNGGIINLSLPEASVYSDSDSESTATGDYYRAHDSSAEAMRGYHPAASARVMHDPRENAPQGGFPSRTSTGPAPRRPDVSSIVPITRDNDGRAAARPNYPMPDQSRPMPGRRGSEEMQPFPPGLSAPQRVSPQAEASSADHRNAPPVQLPARRERRDSFSVPVSRPPGPAPILASRPSQLGGPVQGRGNDARADAPVPQGAGRMPQQNVRPAPPSAQPSNRRPSIQGGREAALNPLSAGPGGGSFPRQQAIQVCARVRWDENLICPSPIPFHERRKGWFNKRGDQLWTNQGIYKSAPQGQEYPPDLAHYPDFGVGWMNEECVRIDMQHRMIPKAPLRSALKRTSVTGRPGLPTGGNAGGNGY
ncbi:hypothetical protein BV25DRAFT_1825320 [Artomyces pyxidatus]|uniref:Uncharacterized protein n=1 Tax=Artomyces pyxidatus TaxID=48021 RepID=A0ACB8T201_9AGAM|nr:hypothetical protein BV25DRAFT_1825320 [Artomyces pyxidatus]